ncbi:MAG: hypothetical protein A2Y33_14685 [Spirochaetes bacterium GWF1_51_8]|nr:MAG: hypothetical protein A2Y33_14685 [Spirochaetes bacterium GWF1_51_8]
MSSITVRNIPEDVFEKIKTLAKTERRSVNNEMVILIEKGLKEQIIHSRKDDSVLSKETQIILWKELFGKWEDDRSTGEIIADIRDARTVGREVEL